MAWGVGIVVGSSGASAGPRALFALERRPAVPVGVDPGGRELAGGRVVEEAVEGRPDLLEGGGVGLRDGPVVPLDAGDEGRVAEVRAADEGDAGAVRALEDVGLGVEGERGRRSRVLGAGGVRGLEDADLPVAFEVEEADEGVGLGDAEVVAGEEAEAAVSGQEVAEVGVEPSRPLGMTKPTAMSAVVAS